MLNKDDFLKPAEILSETVTFRGHEVLVRTVLASEALPYQKYMTENDLNNGVYAVASLIAMSAFVEDDNGQIVHLCGPEDIKAIGDNWTEGEIKTMFNAVMNVGNSINPSEQEKKE